MNSNQKEADGGNISVLEKASYVIYIMRKMYIISMRPGGIGKMGRQEGMNSWEQSR